MAEDNLSWLLESFSIAPPENLFSIDCSSPTAMSVSDPPENIFGGICSSAAADLSSLLESFSIASPENLFSTDCSSPTAMTVSDPPENVFSGICSSAAAVVVSDPPEFDGDSWINMITFDDGEFPNAGNEEANLTAFNGAGTELPNASADEEAGEEDWKLSIPHGMKFRPTDEELITKYLKVEYLNGYIPKGIITYTDIYEHEPDQLRDLAVDHGDNKMYFFTRVKKMGKSKYQRGIRSRNGCWWKATQSSKPIRCDNGRTIGYKSSLTYIRNNNKTNWLMNEYRLESDSQCSSETEETVVAVVYQVHRRQQE